MAAELAKHSCLTASLRDSEVLFQDVFGVSCMWPKIAVDSKARDFSTEAESEVHESVYSLER